jgi:hypothetical protein
MHLLYVGSGFVGHFGHERAGGPGMGPGVVGRIQRDSYRPEQLDYDTGGNGWGNNELQHYTDRPANSYIQNGMLVIEAKRRAIVAARTHRPG